MSLKPLRLLRAVPASMLVLGAAACGSGPSPATSPDGPRLAVLMAVDQLSADLLARYDRHFSGGFRRLLDQGHVFENATHDHSNTETAPGHHTLSTGVHPTRHGVVGNTWYEWDGDSWGRVYSVEDLDHPILGYPDLPGRGPGNTERTGLPDWMLERDPETRVVSISRKDRAAIGLAARARGEVYWLTERGGDFVTSDYYHDELPSWVERFNSEVLPSVYSQTVWESTVPPELAGASRPDTSRHELDGVHTHFPHRAADLVDVTDAGDLNYWRYEYTPFPDEAVLALAREAIAELELGRRSSVDFLGISLSQTDIVGHKFGPFSREQLDNLLRLDRELAGFFDHLDEAVGPDGWVMAFSSDHGVLEIPEILAESGVDAARLDREDRSRFLDAMTGAGPEGEPPSQDEVRAAVSRLPFVETGYTYEEIEAGQTPDTFAALFRNSHSPRRAADLSNRWGVHTRFRPNQLQWSANPATHGSPYIYDRHVPLVFLGAGVAPGTTTDRVATVDAAPTLARLGGIPTPDDLDGRVLESALAGR